MKKTLDFSQSNIIIVQTDLKSNIISVQLLLISNIKIIYRFKK